jgi:two-component system C4-dicarboxylate transport sensor histidine kinase DctB
MTGILINARRAFLTTAATGLVLFLIGYLQINNHISVNAYWRQDFADLSDVFLFIIILTIIAVISWLFNRDLEKSLHRAQTSEAALKQERDLLEIKVEERTAEIKRMQIEKMNQLYRLAEFGRLASGIFHDLVNPLTALSLNLAQAKKTEALKLSQPYIYLQQALAASQKIEELVLALKKQLRTKAEKTNFSVNEEIEQIRKILNYKLIKNNLAINFRITRDYELYGSSLKFSQIILNLLSNAIDAYYTINSNARRPITIETREKNNYFYLIVKDYGTGLTATNLPKIFEPFFTTKNDGQDGLGLGLSTTKNITEKDFGGRITAHRRQPQGAKFIVRLPLKNDHRTINDSLL